MLFSSNIFLFLFLPLTIIIYYVLPRRLRNAFLFLVSIIFYAWGEPTFLIVMLGCILFDYLFALFISKARTASLKRAIFTIAVICNLGLLFVYKYLNFTIANLNNLGFDFPNKEIILPLGISFFTFQAMSYVIDVYRDNAKVQLNPLNIGLYITFFPQLVAGPIVRYQTIADQIISRQETLSDFSEGVKRFIIGFAKKLIIANNMALVADAAFGSSDPTRSVAFAWLGALAYSFQILFDFSGYSDMAIGMGKMFGFHFLENFNYPYISASISEFWRRWHISLGQWFRDYVYFPLGGSRVKSRGRMVFNLFVVWALTGIWHGASWNFLLWGLGYFVLIAFEKLTDIPNRFHHDWQKITYRIFTLLSILLGWVIFRAPGMHAGLNYILCMIGAKGNAVVGVDAGGAIRDYWFFFLAGIVCSTPLFLNVKNKLMASKNKAVVFAVNTLSVPAYLLILLWAVSFIIIGSQNPFIYFNF